MATQHRVITTHGGIEKADFEHTRQPRVSCLNMRFNEQDNLASYHRRMDNIDFALFLIALFLALPTLALAWRALSSIL